MYLLLISGIWPIWRGSFQGCTCWFNLSDVPHFRDVLVDLTYLTWLISGMYLLIYPIWRGSFQGCTCWFNLSDVAHFRDVLVDLTYLTWLISAMYLLIYPIWRGSFQGCTCWFNLSDVAHLRDVLVDLTIPGQDGCPKCTTLPTYKCFRLCKFLSKERPFHHGRWEMCTL